MRHAAAQEGGGAFSVIRGVTRLFARVMAWRSIGWTERKSTAAVSARSPGRGLHGR